MQTFFIYLIFEGMLERLFEELSEEILEWLFD